MKPQKRSSWYRQEERQPEEGVCRSANALIATLVCALAASLAAAPEGLQPFCLWHFDGQEQTLCQDASGNRLHARAKAATRVPGVRGRALRLRGRHMVCVDRPEAFRGLTRITFSAWVRPDDLSSYREIFRKEDGSQRLLFSFQQNGTILSLGLNVGGYVECDASLDPRAAGDGTWHHCAATFDGQWMKVYFDGALIGSLKRPGQMRCGGGAPACIGSTNGSECFQGDLDELAIFDEALGPEDIKGRYQEGIALLRRTYAAVLAQVRRLCGASPDFAEWLMALRHVAASIRHEGELTAALTDLRVRYPESYARFVKVSSRWPRSLLGWTEEEFKKELLEPLIERITEYKPLTPDQWRFLSPQERSHWQQVAEIEKTYLRFLSARGKGAAGAEIIRKILQASDTVVVRPRRFEAVAPYVRPSTPRTHTLSAAEARSVLERDWLFQADNNPTAERILQEIAWARSLAESVNARFRQRIDCGAELAELERLEKAAHRLSSPDRALYCAVREVKRRIFFKNPVIDFNSVLFIDQPYPQGSEWRHQTRHRLGYMAVPGGRLLLLEGLSPAGRLRQLMPRPPLSGSFWRFDLSYSAQKVLFCFKAHNEKSFHLYEIGIDGSGLRRLTWGPYDDLDPVYLPDGRHLLFCTTRGNTYVRCMPPTNAFVLARCDRDGKNIYLISYNNEPDYLPSVTEDGRILYTRWEYTDKPLWRAQALWTANPDGTGVRTLWGNQSVWPDLLKDARQIPGTRLIMFTGSAHHDWFSGAVGIIDPDKGLDFPDGLKKVTAELPWPESGNGPVDPIASPHYHASGRFRAYYSPYPLSEEEFLVSAERAGKFVLYLQDIHGNRELIYEGTYNIFHAMPLRPRVRPPVIPDQVVWPTARERTSPKPGVFYSPDVYEGLSGELRGKARYVRILSIDYKTYTYWYKRPYISTGPVVSAVQSDGVKRILGTVPIEPDGSVAFSAPSGIPLHFQLLDGSFRALHTMRSFTGLMPGERRGCLGCHKMHTAAPVGYVQAQALAREPSQITPPPWSDRTVSYPRYVRPLLDRYCSRCHEGNGKGRSVLDLTPRRGFLFFEEPYLLLIGRPTWGKRYVPPRNPPPGFGIADTLLVEAYDQRDPVAYRTPPPLSRLSYRSRLLELATSGTHYGVRVSPLEARRLAVWIDTMCPYRGEPEVTALEDPVFPGVEWLGVRPRIKTAQVVYRPGPLRRVPRPNAPPFSYEMAAGRRP